MSGGIIDTDCVGRAEDESQGETAGVGDAVVPVEREDHSSSSAHEEDVDVDNHPMIAMLLSHRNTWNSMRYGNYKVCCGGKVMVGPVKELWWLLDIMLIMTTLTFFYDSVKYDKFHFGVTIGAIILFILVIVSSWMVLLCDPGVNPRPEFRVALQNAREAILMNVLNGYPTRTVMKNNEVVLQKYCSKCHSFRERRTRHCFICDSCIENYDHHCGIYGGCVSQKNLRWFRIMVFSTIVHALYIFINAIIVICMVTPSKDEGADSLLSSCMTLDIFLVNCFLITVAAPIAIYLQPEVKHEEVIRPYGVQRPIRRSTLRKTRVHPIDILAEMRTSVEAIEPVSCHDSTSASTIEGVAVSCNKNAGTDNNPSTAINMSDFGDFMVI